MATPEPDVPRFPIRFLTAVIFVSVVGVAGIIWSITRTNALLDAAQRNRAAVLELYGEVVNFDEILTMSTFRFVDESLLLAQNPDGGRGLPDDPGQWRERYFATVDQLDETLKALTATLEGAPDLAAEVRSTAAANEVLVDIEERALGAQDSTQYRAARAELTSALYSAEKARYKEGMDRLFAKIGPHFDERVSDSVIDGQRARILSIVVGLVLVAIWFSVVQALLRWRTVLLAAREETRAALGRVDEMRRQAEAARADAEESRTALSHAVAAGRLGVLTVFVDDRVLPSPRACTMLGIGDRDECTLSDVLAALSSPDATEIALRRAMATVGGGAQLGATSTVETCSGRWLRLAWRPGQTGGATAIFVLLLDVTEARARTARLEQDKARLQDRVDASVARAEQHQSRADFLLRQVFRVEQQTRDQVGRWLHADLQQHVAGARMVAALARDEASGPGRRRWDEVVRSLDGALGSARQIIHQLQPVPIDDQGLVACLHLLVDRLAFSGTLTVQLDAPEDLPSLRPEIARLAYLAVADLLANVTRHAAVDTAEVRVSLTADQLSIVVRDHGPGFDVGALTERAREGSTGLEDLIRLARRVDGDVAIDSTPGEGTRVEVLLPQATDRKGHSGPMPVTRRRASRVLVVDDNEELRRVVVAMLSADERLEVVGTASSGPEAVAVSAALRPDLIVMDYMMAGGFDGAEATRRILASDRAVRVVGLTSMLEAADGPMREAGAVSVVDKAGEPRSLIETLLGPGGELTLRRRQRPSARPAGTRRWPPGPRGGPRRAASRSIGPAR